MYQKGSICANPNLYNLTIVLNLDKMVDMLLELFKSYFHS